ncbi:MAG: hypothetical protein EP329_26520 [Deltaproteobacteria bacterium]|nr:MAG: hypothetical protein EP329_26520 [Deltaproteobacteria bacterium]
MKYVLAALFVCLALPVMAPTAHADCKRNITLKNGTDVAVWKKKVATRPQVGVFTKKKEWTSPPPVLPGESIRIQVTTDVGCDFKIKWKVEFTCPNDYRTHTYCTEFTENLDVHRTLPKDACSTPGWDNC